MKRSPYWLLALILSLPLVAQAAPFSQSDDDAPGNEEPATSDDKAPIEPPPQAPAPKPSAPPVVEEPEDKVDEEQIRREAELKRLRAQVPKVCNAQCGQQKVPWMGRITLPGAKGSVDYLKAEITEEMNYNCLCKSVQTSLNRKPIWSHQHALKECPRRCAREVDRLTKQSGMRWTGHWWTTVWGKHSVCQCATR